MLYVGDKYMSVGDLRKMLLPFEDECPVMVSHSGAYTLAKTVEESSIRVFGEFGEKTKRRPVLKNQRSVCICGE